MYIYIIIYIYIILIYPYMDRYYGTGDNSIYLSLYIYHYLSIIIYIYIYTYLPAMKSLENYPMAPNIFSDCAWCCFRLDFKQFLGCCLQHDVYGHEWVMGKYHERKMFYGTNDKHRFECVWKLSDLNGGIWNYMETWDIDGYCLNLVGRPGFNEPTMTYNIWYTAQEWFGVSAIQR